MNISEEAAARYNTRYRRGCDLIRGRIYLDKSPLIGRLSLWDRFCLRRAIAAFRAALEIAPRQWQCHFWIGKALQRLRDMPGTLEAFQVARSLSPENTTVAKEAAVAAIDMSNPGLAVSFLAPAIADNATDAALFHDMAIALLLLGRTGEALVNVEAAARLDPHSSTTRLAQFINEVREGKRSAPRSMRELRAGM
jgi:tetratricopeptide (TPR) repeat protein